LISFLCTELNFLPVTRYSSTNPKLYTSDLKALIEVIFYYSIFINYGAKNDNVPFIVASFSLSLSIVLQLPTSQIFTIMGSGFILLGFLEDVIRIFYGFMSQCAILIFYR